MSRVKINCANGMLIDKPLVSCFQGTNGNYLIIDNEANGSMGLPIICISKFDGTNLVKVLDQNEWASVKDNLKNIIGGNNFPYLDVPDSLTAGDDFYTQLTLPVASFDVLKNAYNPPKKMDAADAAAQAAAAPVPEVPVPEAPAEENTIQVEGPNDLGVAPITEAAAPAPEVAPIPDAAPVVDTPAPVIDAPVPPEAESVPAAPEVAPIPDAASAVDTPAPVIEAPVPPEAESVPAAPEVAPIPDAAPAVDTPAPVIDAPVPPEGDPMTGIDPSIVSVDEITNSEIPADGGDTIDPMSLVSDPTITDATAPVAPQISEDPIATPDINMPESPIVEPGDINAIKENFMKSCETMFDALIKKFEENKN